MMNKYIVAIESSKVIPTEDLGLLKTVFQETTFTIWVHFRISTKPSFLVISVLFKDTLITLLFIFFCFCCLHERSHSTANYNMPRG